jgi:hypothetical protein
MHATSSPTQSPRLGSEDISGQRGRRRHASSLKDLPQAENLRGALQQTAEYNENG